MKRTAIILMCLMTAMLMQSQEDKQKKANQLSTTAKAPTNSKTAVLLKFNNLEKPSDSNIIGSGDFNPNYPNFYTFWDNKYWPMDVINIQYQPRTTLTVPTNNNRMSIQVTAKTDIPLQDIINTGPPIYETSDLKFYEELFLNSKDYVIIFNFNGQGTMIYYHRTLMPDYFKQKK